MNSSHEYADTRNRSTTPKNGAINDRELTVVDSVFGALEGG